MRIVRGRVYSPHTRCARWNRGLKEPVSEKKVRSVSKATSNGLLSKDSTDCLKKANKM